MGLFVCVLYNICIFWAYAYVQKKNLLKQLLKKVTFYFVNIYIFWKKGKKHIDRL